MLVCESAFRALLKPRMPVILGCESLTALGIMRCLGRAKIPCLGIAFSDGPGIACRSRFGQVLLLAELTDSLLDLLPRPSSAGGKGVLYCATDEAVLFVDRHVQRLQRDWHLFTSHEFSLEHLVDKGHMTELARESGFDVPYTVAVSRGGKLDRDRIAAMPYPCIVKPANSLGPGKETYKIVTGEGGLLSAIEGLLARCPRVVAQEYIGESEPGEVLEAFAFRSRVPPHDNYICTIEKDRVYPHLVGSSSFIRTAVLPELHQPIRRFLELIAFDGIVDFEFVRSADRLFFIEANYRPGTPIALSQRAGLNLPALAYWDAVGIPFDNGGGVRPGIHWLRDNTDWKHVREGRITARRFVGDALRAREFLILAADDPRPFVAYLSGLLRKAGRRLHGG